MLAQVLVYLLVLSLGAIQGNAQESTRTIKVTTTITTRICPSCVIKTVLSPSSIPPNIPNIVDPPPMIPEDLPPTKPEDPPPHAAEN
ncbi:uncharacterized protein CGFF_05375 [Nakaseomyces glabratus]|nr:uncharacterized protein CGFF_04962 [Nakaseomyces glabratus]SLM17191.1 uncharacterized protein CGFF_05375 [Nakaseomyces glabratus]